MHLNKDVESWARVVPKDVAAGSATQAANVLEMALFDIQKLGAELEHLRDVMRRCKEDITDGDEWSALMMLKTALARHV